MIELIGIIAAVLELTAVFMLGKKNPYGFIVASFGNIWWIVYVVNSTSAFGLLLVSTTALALNIKGYMNWRN